MKLPALFLLVPCLAFAQDGWWHEPEIPNNEGFVLNRLDDTVVFALYTEWESCFADSILPTVSPSPPPEERCDPTVTQPPTVSPPPPNPPEPIDLQCDCGMPFWVTGISDTFEDGLASGTVFFSPNFVDDVKEAIPVGQFFYVEDEATETIVVEVAWTQNQYLNRCHGIYGEYIMDRLVNPNLERFNENW